MKAQRDQALACSILAACISLAVFLSAFGNHETVAIEKAQRAVAVHEAMLRQSTEIIRQNKTELYVVTLALENLEQSQRR